MFGEFLSPKVVLALLAAVLLAVVALTGGLKTATAAKAKELPTVKPGEATTAYPLEVTVLKAFQGDGISPILSKSDKHRYIIVTARLKNLTTHYLDADSLGAALASWRVARIDTPGLSQLDKVGVKPNESLVPEVYRLNDAKAARSLQPGLEQTVIFAWQQDRSFPAPTQVKVTLYELTYRRSVSNGSMGWFDDNPVAEVTVDVKPIPTEK